jgi:histidyl-tRNA synthetase
VLNLLRKNNVITDIYLGKEKSIKNQITYALKNNYKAAIILGEDELKKKKAKIKFFEKFIEKEIDFAKIHQVVKKEFKI